LTKAKVWPQPRCLRATGSGNGQFSGSAIHYIPFKTGHGVVGVLGYRADSSKEPIPPAQQDLLVTCVNQAALAITRAVLAQEAHRVEVLEQTAKLQKALLNTISHNLRTPLATIIGALGVVLQDGGLLDASTNRKAIGNSTHGGRATEPTSSKPSGHDTAGGAAHVRMERCDVQDVVGSALEQLKEVARERSISVIIAPDLPFVRMDAVLIVQVLVNLVDNALKYSSEDAPIAVEASRADGHLRIRVADGGQGIAKQDLERVFEKFFRGSAAGVSGGSGLGLSICKGFVEAHGGGIWAARGEQGGTEMVFALPLERQR
jgi:two-component system sensor histidine kinase KdpD